jgi:tetratricopeptide (TPR) repeat protein
MRATRLAAALGLLTLTSKEALAQDSFRPASVGEAIHHLGTFFGTTPGHVVLVLGGGLVALRIYYAGRSALSAGADARLGPPRGLLGTFLAKKRLAGLVAQQRYEEAADLLQACDPGRVLEAAELYIKAKRYTHAAALLVANNRLSRAAETYARAGSHDLAAELFEKAEEFERAEEHYLRAGNKLSAARLLARTHKPERAARLYSEAESPREAGEQLEKAGKKREAVEQYVHALALLGRPDTSAVGVRPGERRIGHDHARDELCQKIVELYAELGDTEGQIRVLIEQERPADAARVLQAAGRGGDAARLLAEHHLVPEKQLVPDTVAILAVLDGSGAGPDTRRRLLARAG